MLRRNVFSYIAIFTLIISLTACARTVTDKDEKGSEIQVTITLKTAPDFANYSYYFLISNINTNFIDITNPNFYFFAPGKTYDPVRVNFQTSAAGIVSYYQSYFSSWTDFIYFEGSQPKLVKGLFPATTASDTEHFSFSFDTTFNPTNSGTGNVLRWTFPLLNLRFTGTTLYFTILTIEKSPAGQGNVIDKLTSTKTIPIESTRVNSDVDTDEFTLPAAADIDSWRIDVF